MTGVAIGMMIVILGLVWGRLVWALVRMNKMEKEKPAED